MSADIPSRFDTEEEFNNWLYEEVYGGKHDSLDQFFDSSNNIPNPSFTSSRKRAIDLIETFASNHIEIGFSLTANCCKVYTDMPNMIMSDYRTSGRIDPLAICIAIDGAKRRLL